MGRKSTGRAFVRAWFVVFLQLILAGCTRVDGGDFVLFDFETDSELDRMEWNCHTLQSLSAEHVTHGIRSLKVELYPSDYPGVSPVLTRSDWSGYKELCFDIYNPQEHVVTVIVRIDDQRQFPAYEERYNKGFLLRPGMNRMNIPFSTLLTSGSGRRLNLKGISRLMIFLSHPRERVVLYLDYIRLSRGERAV